MGLKRFSPHCIIEVGRDSKSVLDTYCVTIRYEKGESSTFGVPSAQDVGNGITRDLLRHEEQERKNEQNAN